MPALIVAKPPTAPLDELVERVRHIAEQTTAFSDLRSALMLHAATRLLQEAILPIPERAGFSDAATIGAAGIL